MMKKIIAVILMVALMCCSAYATTVSRSLSHSSVGKDEQVSVTLEVDVSGDSYYLIDEEYPAHMSVSDVTGEGDYTTTDGHIFWVVLQDATDISYSYTLRTGDHDGTYIFKGTYGSESKDETPILGTDKISVGTGHGGDESSSGDDRFAWVWLIVIGAILFFVMSKKR
jgi:hypothetical protein